MRNKRKKKENGQRKQRVKTRQTGSPRPDTHAHPHAVFPALASPACLCFVYAM